MRSDILSVQKIQEVSALLSVPDSRIIAGGTSYSPAAEETFHLVDISGLEGLDGIKKKGTRIEFGPLVTLSALADSSLVRSYAPALSECAAAAADPDIRDLATLGGNLASARIGDTALPLLACGAKLTIKTDCDYRELLIDRFWNSGGENDLNYDEWIMRISIQLPREAFWGSAFAKTGEWDLTGEQAAAAAVQLSLDERDIVTGIRGGIRLRSGCVRRMFPLEKALKNKAASDENIEKAAGAMARAVQAGPEDEDLCGMLTDILQRAVSMARERRSL